jgi:acetyl-CoA decarbonylase/synthase complex subunit delta
MRFELPLEKYSANIREVVLGQGEKTVRIGGEDTFPFHSFEGTLPNLPGLVLEVLDTEPENWAPAVLEPFQDVVSDPASWAKKCVDVFDAEILCLRLASTDPLGKNSSAKEAAEIAKSVAEATNVPLMVMGTGTEDKDAQVLSEVAKACTGKNLLLGPLLKGNYRAIAEAAKEHGHAIVAQASMDANLTKELNIALCKFFPAEKIVVDPTSSALGYGFEYTFSIIERIKQFGLVDRDTMMQMPILADIAGECWRTKEAKESREQGILWEAITGITFLLAGANLLVLRHPDTLRLIKEMISD